MLGEHEAGGGGGWESVRFCSPLRCVVRRQSFPKRGRTRQELKAPRVVACVRERVLFIGTEFSILYTSMHSPA